MRDERNVVEKDVVETARLEELSDEDLEVVAGGQHKPNLVAIIATCATGNTNPPFCSG
jgi:ABC-type enterochelin transport system ATPase subunit